MANNSAEEKKASILEIGEKLRQAREKKGVTIEQAQKQTHIHSTVLTALEEGRCDDILTPNYVKSFLKEYSSYLGFDHQKMVGDYLAVHPELKTRNINLGAGKTDQKSSADLAKMIRIARSVTLFLLLISLAVFLSSKTAAFFKNLKAVTKAGTSKYTSTAARANPSSAKAVASRKGAAAKNTRFTMTLKVHNPVMVQLKKDGALIFKRVLPKGMEETFTADNSVNMFVGRAEAIEIVVNGKSLGTPGRGIIRNIEVTSNGVRVK